MEFLGYLLTGAVAGTLAGLFGVGGGIYSTGTLSLVSTVVANNSAASHPDIFNGSSFVRDVSGNDNESKQALFRDV